MEVLVWLLSWRCATAAPVQSLVPVPLLDKEPHPSMPMVAPTISCGLDRVDPIQDVQPVVSLAPAHSAHRCWYTPHGDHGLLHAWACSWARRNRVVCVCRCVRAPRYVTRMSMHAWTYTKTNLQECFSVVRGERPNLSPDIAHGYRSLIASIALMHNHRGGI